MTTKHSANFPETLDPRTKMTLTAGTAIATVAFSGLLAQTTLFAATFLYLASTRRARMMALLYAGAGAIIAVAWALRKPIFKVLICIGLVILFFIMAVVTLPSIISGAMPAVP